jgi:uncharacterized repeat protein (TIGR03833 family)
MDDPCDRNDVNECMRVIILEEKSSKSIIGTVKRILTKVDYHSKGIKVELTNNLVGRITKFLPNEPDNELDKELIQEFEKNRYSDEDENLEFKATFRFSMDGYKHTQIKKTSVAVEHSISKTLAAFGNTSGGTLYIGVDDATRDIIGLNFDYELCKTQDADGFRFDLKNSINHMLDAQFYYLSHKLTRIIPYDGKEICVIKMEPSMNALILDAGSKKEYYVRVNDMSIPFTIHGFLNHYVDHIIDLRKL